ncbi:MAG: dUTP diphosphatase [Candidatus Daviesbacteria bacterium]|nr:dUTP diphosphatase [Candidatus Daviesbacteria bacterium]
MLVKIKRIDKSIPLPEYQTKGSVGCDLHARVTTKIKPKSLGKIPTNVIIQTPPGFMFMLASRGSTPFKKGLMPANGVGIGDQDFCGEEDEYLTAVYNFTNKTVVVEKGERIAQGIFIPVEVVKWKEVDSMKHNTTRGGFGSTGGHKVRIKGKG